MCTELYHFLHGTFFVSLIYLPLRRKPINKQVRWANKEEAKLFAKQAEELGNLGLSYLSACDYLGWNLSIRREIMAANKRKAKERERRVKHRNKEVYLCK